MNLVGILFIFGFVTIVCWYIKYLWTKRKIYRMALKIPGPPSYPIIGSGYMFLGSGSENWPGLCKLWMGNELVILISEPKYIEIVLNNPNALEKHDVYSILSEVLGQGMLTLTAKTWKHHRKTVAPSFNQKVLDSFVDIFAEKSKIFARQLKKVVGKKNVDWYGLVSKCTLDMVCQTAMGVNMNIQCDNEQSIGECLETLMELANHRIFRFYLHSRPIWNLTKLKQQFDKNVKEFEKITSAVIKKKMEDFKNQQVSHATYTYNEATDKWTNRKRAFLDLLLESSDFSEDELRDEMTTFLGAGTETSAATVCALFTVLGIFPEIQQKIYEEVLDIMGSDRDVEASDLPKMIYTERVIKETLRLFPIAALFGRKLTGEIHLDDIVLPSGCSVVFCPVYIQRNQRFWKDPLKFDPDRFLVEETSKRHPCTYIPFSYGPRNCIGGRYAILNIKAVVATVVRQFRIFSEYKSIEEIELKMQLLLRFKDGFKIWLEER